MGLAKKEILSVYQYEYTEEPEFEVYLEQDFHDLTEEEKTELRKKLVNIL